MRKIKAWDNVSLIIKKGIWKKKSEGKKTNQTQEQQVM